ncbi:MAG TPA: HIT domain-containing protein [candidate division WOR-3 bacterium]|uniref:HIT domain-containing protein n=1 Tax=candidate division WOR-3 bacterium TaxID=2052148 RepID=A0A7V0T6N2_UNCW3|nr:HIT domain-containing protein [candidate division WOR-3 bacterium]
MKRLWAPWRGEYIRAASARCRAGEKQCLFCALRRSRDDETDLVLCRDELAFAVLNRFPYNNGHLMVAPNRHVAAYDRLRPAETAAIDALVQRAIRALRRDARPHGFNVGMNLGRVAGAGEDTHLHVHVVPRWNGDTNFMPALAGTKVMSEHLQETRRRLRPLMLEKTERRRPALPLKKEGLKGTGLKER